jgi:hypothetical protein
MNAKKIGVIIGIVVFLVLGLCFGAYRRGAADTRDNFRTERRAAEIGKAHTELGDEQRANEERLERSANLIERIAGFTEKAGSDARKLRESNRRSGDLLLLLEQEVDILEDYINSMLRELAGYRGDGASGGAAVEIGE